MNCETCERKANSLVCRACRQQNPQTHSHPSLSPADLERPSCNGTVAKKAGTGRHTPCSIRVHSVRKHLADPDGISCKAVLDGLTKSGILRDDNASIVKEVRFTQTPGKDEETIITIEWDGKNECK